MPDYIITVTDEQDSGLTLKNSGAYPNNAACLTFYIQDMLNSFANESVTIENIKFISAIRSDPALLATIKDAIDKSGNNNA